jgi:hypothetical protein
MKVEIIHKGEQNIYSYPSQVCYTDDQLFRDFQSAYESEISELGFTFVCSVEQRIAEKEAEINL